MWKSSALWRELDWKWSCVWHFILFLHHRLFSQLRVLCMATKAGLIDFCSRMNDASSLTSFFLLVFLLYFLPGWSIPIFSSLWTSSRPKKSTSFFLSCEYRRLTSSLFVFAVTCAHWTVYVLTIPSWGMSSCSLQLFRDSHRSQLHMSLSCCGTWCISMNMLNVKECYWCPVSTVCC